MQEARAQLKIGGATPGGSGGRGVSPVFRFGAVTPVHFDRIGVATPKNPCDRILGVAMYHRQATGVAATSNFGLQHQKVVDANPTPYSFSVFFLSFSIFSHTTGQKSAYLIGETDSTVQFTLWSPWTATSQTPWIRSYTPSLATINTYHQSPLSFTYHTLLHNPGHFTTNTTSYYIQHITYNNPTTYINNPYAQSYGHAGLMQAHADPMQAVMQSHVLSTPISVVCGCASPDP